MTAAPARTGHYSAELQLADGRAMFTCDGSAYVLPHEHLLINLAPWWEGDAPFGSVIDDPGLTDDTIAAAAHSPLEVVRENLLLSDWVGLARELYEARRCGLALVVDLTSEGLEPDHQHALAAARAAGVALVLGVGHYREPHFAPMVREESAEDRAERWLRQWRDGFGDGTFPGVVGEIGTSAAISTDEQKSLRAAAFVSSETNAAISIHIEPFAPTEHDVVATLSGAGAKPERVVLSHCDVDLDERRLHEIADLGTYIEFDLFGWPADCLVRDQPMPSDADRLSLLEKMIHWGVGDRLLLSHDICTRTQWIRYGGTGYRYIGKVLREKLEALVGHGHAEKLLIENPLRMLSGTDPYVPAA
jgi:phosphotriesterase-related protein